MADKGIGTAECPTHGEYYLDAEDSPCPGCEDTETDNILRCQECNSTQVHVAMWVDANTGEKFDDVFPLDPWCCDCEDHVTLWSDLGPTHYNCCHAPKDLGHMFGCPNSTENERGDT